jgi:hypothetical protein
MAAGSLHSSNAASVAHRSLPVMKGHCRLCWCQARLDRSAALDGAIGTVMTSAGVIFKRCGCKGEATKRRLG